MDHRKTDRSCWQGLLLLIVAYGCAFIVLLELAKLWAVGEFNSLLFPAAGLRLAVLWHFGPRIAPLLAIVETTVLAIGNFSSGGNTNVSVLGSGFFIPLAYGAAVLVARRVHVQWAALKPMTLQFGFAAFLAPLAAFFASTLWRVAQGDDELPASGPEFLSHLIILIVGELLGILLVAPPILWAWRLASERQWPGFGSWRTWATATLIIGLAALVSLGVRAAGFGVRLLPLMLAVVAVGILNGAVAAFGTVLVISFVIMSWTAAVTPAGMDVGLHIELIGVVILAFLGGSYADDQRRMREEIRIKDSALLHSERLKTLRAMSLAVIHELSQPLSTLSIETRYLARLSQSRASDREEINQVAHLIAHKTESLANMLRRLRSFGAAPGEKSCTIDVEKLARDVVTIIAPEARSAGVRIEMRIKKHLAVDGQELELQQALTNLLRNAIAASPHETVKLVAQDGCENTIRVDVINTPKPSTLHRKGMGIGKLIVEAIAEIHGGSLAEERSANGERRMILTLPNAAPAGTL